MNWSEIVIWILLTISAGVGLFCGIGLLIMPGVFNKLHYLAPLGIVSAATITAAILIQSGFSQNGIKSLIVLVLLVLSNPVLTQATAQTARHRMQCKNKAEREEQNE